MKIGGLFTAMRTTLSGLSNQVKRMDVISENIANAEKSPDSNGKVYQRKVVTTDSSRLRGPKYFKNELGLRMRRNQANHMNSAAPEKALNKNNVSGPNPMKIEEINSEKLVYNPGHPRADENGYVKMPDVNVVDEMVDLIASTRTYEANVTVLNAAKQMAKRALEI